ncbi:MAG: Hint domain-containing protein, partial [Rhodobacteraceae bacterium]|nr:Hint domain-containing protein [Paracoccaceae bacterium]
FGPNGQGNDTFIGADGNDEIWAGTDDDSVTGGLGSDSLFGQSGNDTIDGGADADTLQGGIGHDSVSGGDGADLIEEYVPGGTTVNDGDTVTGTTGADAFVFGGDPGTSATIILDDGSGTANDADTEYDIVFVTSTGNGASLAVEGFDYGTDRIQVSEDWSGLASNEIAPGHHEVTLTYADGNSQTFDVFHDNGSVFDPAQAFFTYAGDDTLEGGAGNDTISGAFGADLITGGTGNDNIDVGAGDGVVDTVVMSDGDGDDTITGFDGPVDNGDGTFTGQDQLDLSGMTDAGGARLNTRDVTVGNDGSGNAVLNFPNGDSITLVGIAPADVTDEDALAAMGIAAPDDVVEGTASGETIDAGYIGDPEGDRVDAGDNAAGNDDDSITAGAGNDTVAAGDGNDTVLGEGGADSIDGGIGDDNIDGGSENDTVFAWTGDDSVIGDTGDDVIFGQDGADTIRGGEGADSLDGDDATAGADQIFGDAGNDTIISDGGNDTIEGGADNDLIFAGADDDSVSGGTGNDQIFGEGGNDLIEADEGDDTVDGGDGNDTIFGFEGSDSVLGGAGDDEINTRTSPGTGLPDEGYGTLGDAGYYPSDPGSANDTDFVDGGLGNDIILTGDDNDTIFGGDGADTVDAGFDDDQIDGGAGADSIEGNEGNDTIVGGADGDIIYGDVSPDNPDYAFFVPYDLPNDGTDLAPSNNADSLVGGDGDDTIYGQDDNDTLVGDAGNDVLDGGLDDDSLDGADGNDTLIGGTGNDTLLGGNDTGADSLDGGAGDDELSAGDGADTLVGGTGADSMFGGGGDDVFVIEDDFGNDTIDGWSTNETGGDSLDAGAVTQDLTLDLSQGSTSDPESGTLSNGAQTASFIEIETITLGSGNDSVTGSTGGDTVNTGAGNDTVDAGDGADSIDAGTGDDSIFVDQGDTVSGGDGDDFFTLQDLDTSGTGNAAITITGGEGAETNGDTLQLTPDVAFSDITFSNTDDAAGGLSGSFTMADGTSVTFSEIENIICFTPGTKILTGHGERDIETLQIGDMVVTRDHGLRPIRWIGKRTVAGTGRFAPVWVGSAAMDGARAGFLVSPQHRMLFTGYRAELLFGDSEVLVPAKHLIDGRDVVRREQDEVTYIHIMFDRHEVIYAEGIATESFHAGDVGLSAICEEAREELFALFPELRTAPGHHRETARVCLKKHEAQLLVRDQDNGASFA